MAERFSFRPAPLRGVQVWTLDGDVLAGPNLRRDLAQVERAAFVETEIRGMRLRRLDLFGPEGLTRIGINCTTLLPPDDPERAAHRDLCLAILRRLAARAPDLPVTLAETGAVRAVWFGVGVLALLAGPGIGLAALATGVDGDRLIGAAFPVLMLGALGAFMTWVNRPWLKPPSLQVSLLPGLIEVMDGKAHAAPSDPD